MKRRGDIFTLELFGDAREETPRAQKTEPAAGSLAYGPELRALITQMIKDSPYDRYEIAARMSRYLGTTISKTTVDTWTADSKHQHRFPFEYAPALEHATDSYGLTDWLTKKRDGEFVVGREVLLAELGRIAGAKSDLRRYEQELKKHLQGSNK